MNIFNCNIKSTQNFNLNRKRAKYVTFAIMYGWQLKFGIWYLCKQPTKPFSCTWHYADYISICEMTWKTSSVIRTISKFNLKSNMSTQFLSFLSRIEYKCNFQLISKKCDIKAMTLFAILMHMRMTPVIPIQCTRPLVLWIYKFTRVQNRELIRNLFMLKC